MGDNVDHNTATITGSGTFHGLGNLMVGNRSKNSTLMKIPRLKGTFNVSNLHTSEIPIYVYNHHKRKGLSSLLLKPVEDLSSSKNVVKPPTLVLNDLLWHFGWFICSPLEPRPNWSGFMQSATNIIAEIHTKSKVDVLPILDLNPNSDTCIYSTLLFVINEAATFGVATPCITFDQPLYLRAMRIVKAENLRIVCRLDGFHTLMSFLGSIGNLMKGTGIEELFEEVYAKNTVPHMLSGKAIQRSLRAHILAQSALTSLLLDEVEADLSSLKVFYEKVLTKTFEEVSFNEMTNSDVFKHISNILEECDLSSRSRTAKVWLQLMSDVDIVKTFVFAERTSNWKLHLSATAQMMNLFTATGHRNYALSARLYILLFARNGTAS